MSTTFSIRLEEKTKKDFLKNAKKRGLDWWIIIRHFINLYNKNPEIVKFWIDEDDWNTIVKNMLQSPIYDEWNDGTIYYENENNFWICNENWLDTDKIISVINEVNAR
jgi:hypothetical protein